MIVKKRTTRDGQLLLAICDSNLKGKKFSENGIQLDLSSEFYNGEEMDEDDRNVVKKLIDAFITKKQVQKLAH